MKQSLKSAVFLGAGVAAVVGLAVAPASVGAADTTSIQATVATSASVSSTSGTVALAITPVVGGSFSNASDTVVAGTNNATGYTLQVSAAATNLVNGGNTIAASTGTPASPIALANNTWGYRVDNQYGFGAGPTASQTDQASLAGTWAGVTTSPVNIKTTTGSSASDSTTVWYGVGADTSKPGGAYSQTVTYTATTNL